MNRWWKTPDLDPLGEPESERSFLLHFNLGAGNWRIELQDLRSFRRLQWVSLLLILGPLKMKAWGIVHSPNAVMSVTVFLFLVGVNIPENQSMKGSPSSVRAKHSGKHPMDASLVGMWAHPVQPTALEYSDALLLHLFYFYYLILTVKRKSLNSTSSATYWNQFGNLKNAWRALKSCKQKSQGLS